MARWQKIALLVIVVAALILLVRTVVWPRLSGSSGDAAVIQETEFVTVSRGTIMTTVNASGSIVYPEQVALGFSTPADLREIFVAVGDEVAEGAPLASIDDTDLQLMAQEKAADLRTAEVNLERLQRARPEDIRTAELAVVDAEAKLAELLDGPPQTEINDAETAVINAQVAYDKAVKALAALRNPEESDIAAARNEVKTAEDALIAAQANLDALRAGGSGKRIQAAENALLIARNRYHEERERIKEGIEYLDEELKDKEERAEGDYDNTKEGIKNLVEELGNVERRLEDAKEALEVSDNSSTRSKLEDAQEDYDEIEEEAKEKIEELVLQLLPNPPRGTEAGELLGAVREAEFALKSARVSTTDDEQAAQRSVESAMRTLTSARDRLDALLNPSAEDVTLAEREAHSAQLSLENAQRKRDELLQGSKSEDVARARNELELKRLDLQDKRTGASAQDLELERLKVERAQRSLETAQQDLAEATLRAPFAGVVATVEGSVGQEPPAVVVTLVRTERVEMHARVDEADVGSVAKGQPVVVTTYASPDVKIPGVVETISPISTTEQGVVLFPITILLEPGDQRLRGGLSANALIEVSSRENVLLVPNRAIRREGDERVVYVRQEGGALERRVVEIGVRDSEFSEILSGVNEGEEVAVPSRAGGNIGGGGIDIRTR